MSKITSSQSFYDEISRHYNTIMATASNDDVRNKVARIFTSAVKAGNVMDFGGGTGSDLPWLLKANYCIFFCEPSPGMRRAAREWLSKECPTGNVSFVTHEKTDFRLWESARLPVQEKMEAILANFAVLNCIEDIKELFEKISQVIKPQGLFFCTVIDTRLKATIMKYPRQTIQNLLSGRAIVTTNKYSDVSHRVYLHTINEITKKASSFFEIEQVIPLGGFGFLLLRLRHLL